MKFAIVIGTRPEIIKMSSIIKHCLNNNIPFDIIHTQQHYSNNMDRIFFESLNLNYPNIYLGVKSNLAHLQISDIINKCGEIFYNKKYDIILVQGDTNTVLGASLAAQKCGLKIGHVEAGLRSYDRSMPEEINRLLTDQISDYCFCPTEVSKDNLLKEGITSDRIYVVGNTIVDVVYENMENISNNDIIYKYNISGKYALVTIHRPSNVDDPNKLKILLSIFNDISRIFNLIIVFPVHPRTLNVIRNSYIDTGNILTIDPVGYIDFLSLIYNSEIVLTDSGGIQEESCILKKPCITLRDNTERPETVSVGANILTGINMEKIFYAIEIFKNKNLDWDNPFGYGKASEKIIRIVLNSIS